ncbi:MAG: aminoacyl-histidine dipeptidase [Candidatus Aminicenantes bacterium]|nr:aminoacyl-histidine dipeptidase [Candidatus Aminicenantes bacterium]
MADILANLKPTLLWKHFSELLRIPHCSGNERALGDYIISVAKEWDFAWDRDRVGNVVVSKPATPGHERSAGVILQGHLDMVGEKNSDVTHDFSKDPITPEIKGDWVGARGTTLGSDNGIGVAAALAVIEDQTLVHGPLEFLFTVDEETGLTGANRLKKDFLKGTRLLNLDSEEEGTFTIGCSGGGDSEIILPLQRKRRRFKEIFRLRVFGFRGGHSGLDINQGRGNALRLLARLLFEAEEKFKFELLRMEGGNKRNAIPREAWADIYIDGSVADKMRSFFKDAFAKIQNEFKVVETEAQSGFEKSADSKDDPLTVDSQKTLIRLVLTLPHGVISMHPEITGLVETSTNLAIIRCEKARAQVICSSRSSVASALAAVRQGIKAVSELAGARIVQTGGYPGWEPNLQSVLLKKLSEVYKKVFGKEPEVKAVHAGLECGIIGQKYTGMDMISFGPTIEHPHSPEERVHVGSVEKFWHFLTTALRELA